MFWMRPLQKQLPAKCTASKVECVDLTAPTLWRLNLDNLRSPRLSPPVLDLQNKSVGDVLVLRSETAGVTIKRAVARISFSKQNQLTVHIKFSELGRPHDIAGRKMYCLLLAPEAIPSS